MKRQLISYAIAALLVLPAVAAKVPTKEEVVAAGQKPYLRYTVGSANMILVSNSIFEHRSFKDKSAIDGLPRGTARDLQLVGEEVYTEVSEDKAAQVVVNENAVILYRRRADGKIIPLYFADCTMNGKPWYNRIALVHPLPPEEEVESRNSTPIIAQAAAPNITVQPAAVTPGSTVVNNNGAPFPNPLNVNLAGIPIQPGMPSDITIRVINETKVDRDAFQKLNDVGSFILKTGGGYALARTPDVVSGIARAKNNSNERIANINGQALVDAAKGRVPDIFQITSSASPTLNNTSNPSASNNAPVNTTTTSQSNPTVSPTISPNNNNSASSNASAPSAPAPAPAPTPNITINNAPNTTTVDAKSGDSNSTSDAKTGDSTSTSEAKGGEGGKGGNSSSQANGGEGGKAEATGGSSNSESKGGSVNNSGNADVDVKSTGGNAKSDSNASADAKAKADADAKAAADAAAKNNNTNQNTNDNNNENKTTLPAPPPPPDKGDHGGDKH